MHAIPGCEVVFWCIHALHGAGPTATAWRCRSHAAPELLRDGWLTRKADIYAFALLMWACLTGRLPYEDVHALRVGSPGGERDVCCPLPVHTRACLRRQPAQAQ